MKKLDAIIYLFLLIVGCLMGWVLHSIAYPQQPTIIYQMPYQANVPPNTLPVQNDLSKTNVENKTVSNTLPQKSTQVINEKMVEKVNQVLPEIKEEVDKNNEINNIKNKLARNEFYEVLMLLNQFKNIAGKEAFASEVFEMLSVYIQNKVNNKEGQNLLADIEKALSNEPGSWPIIVLKGKIFIAMGDFEEGAKNLKKEMFYVRNDKEFAELQNLVRLLRSKRIEQLRQQKLNIRLVEYYEELIVEDSAFSQYYFDLAKLYIEKRDYENALVMLRLIVFDQTYGKEAESLIQQVIAAQELEANKYLVQWENKTSIEIPVLKVNDRYLVTVILNEKLPVKLLVDTGANISVITENTAIKLGIDLNAQKDLRWIQTAGGMVKQAVIKLNSLTLNNIKMTNIQTTISKDIGAEIDGLLGMNFLNRFNFEINQERNVLILKTK